MHPGEALLIKCSDPYGTGCQQVADGFMRGQKYNPFIQDYEETRIYMCPTCTWWNCDWDWDASPEGPSIG